MIVTIESADGKFIVRCTLPSDPPFRATQICDTLEEAQKVQTDMLNFPPEKFDTDIERDAIGISKIVARRA